MHVLLHSVPSTLQQATTDPCLCWTLTGAAERSYPTSEVRGGSQEELPHVQGAAAAQAQEGREELIHVQG